MIVNDKRYNNINFELKKQFSQKIIKLSLDGGFTCPTRDGKLDTRGCIFCSKNGSGEFTNFHTDIKIQIDEQIKLLSNKWQNCKYIAYFQNFTNTYKNADELMKLYNSALTSPDVIGLSVATRADC